MRNTKYFNIDENQKFIENYYDTNNTIKQFKPSKKEVEKTGIEKKIKAHRNAFHINKAMITYSK